MTSDEENKNITESKEQDDITILEDDEKIVEHTLEISSSPLPSPSLLKEYQDLIPNAPERLLTIIEKEQDNSENKRRDRNKLLMFLVIPVFTFQLGLLGLCAYMIYQNKVEYGLALALAMIVFQKSLNIFSKKKDDSE